MKKTLFAALLISTICSFAQQGGQHTFSFLNLESNARITATGGSMIAVKDGDVNLGFYNPSLLDSNVHKSLAVNYINYFAGINYAFAGYAHNFGKLTGAANLMYLNYGKFDHTDILGNKTGTFTGNDMVLNLGAGYQIDSLFSIGANLKFINSVIYIYGANGAAVDLSGTFHKPSKNFTASFIVRNLGMQFKSYTETGREPLPASIEIGISKKASKAPFRWAFAFKDLQTWDLTYKDPNAKPQLDENGDPLPIEEPGFLNKFMHHVGVGLEFIPSESFFIDAGFNYRRRQELKLEAKPGTVGMSVGIGIKIKRFLFTYGRATYHRAGASNNISITTNIK